MGAKASATDRSFNLSKKNLKRLEDIRNLSLLPTIAQPESIYLQHNKLEYLSPRVLRDTITLPAFSNQLALLDLRHNKLEDIPSELFYLVLHPILSSPS